MKKRIVIIVFALFVFTGFTANAWAQCSNLPGFPVTATYAMGVPGWESFFKISFSGIGPGFDVEDGVPYVGWCVENNHRSNTNPVILYCSLDPLPGNLGDFPWDKINYVLNHKQGIWQAVQAVIWHYIFGPVNYGLDGVQAMINDAEANGAGFVPGTGEIVAVILYTGDGGIGPDGFQDALIEIQVTDGGGEGCTPGYWKQEHHLDSWMATGFDPTDDFDTTFGVDFFDPDITLYDAAWARGGGVNRLARHGTAALLSAAHPDVNYPYTVAQVIALVQGGDADALEEANELGCPLN